MSRDALIEPSFIWFDTGCPASDTDMSRVQASDVILYARSSRVNGHHLHTLARSVIGSHWLSAASFDFLPIRDGSLQLRKSLFKLNISCALQVSPADRAFIVPRTPGHQLAFPSTLSSLERIDVDPSTNFSAVRFDQTRVIDELPCAQSSMLELPIAQSS